MKKKILLAGVALGSLVIAGAAGAADLPARTPYYKAPVVMPNAYNWSGFYIGANVGYGWQDYDSTVITGTATFPAGTAFTRNSANGIMGGGQIGYNWQWSNWVLGIEGEFDGADLRQTSRTFSTTNTNFSDSHVNTPWVGLATGRIGYAWANWLLYAKGGWAWARNEATGNTFNAAGTLTSTTYGKETRDGWALGGGLEWGFGTNWSAKVEYMHIDLGTENVNRTYTFSTTPGLVGTTLVRRNDVTIDMVKFGVNYRFNWGGPILARY